MREEAVSADSMGSELPLFTVCPITLRMSNGTILLPHSLVALVLAAGNGVPEPITFESSTASFTVSWRRPDKCVGLLEGVSVNGIEESLHEHTTWQRRCGSRKLFSLISLGLSSIRLMKRERERERER